MVEKIYEILNSINIEIMKYEGEDMIEDGIIDSLEVMEIATKLEDEFNFELTADDIVPENFNNVKGIIALVSNKI